MAGNPAGMGILGEYMAPITMTNSSFPIFAAILAITGLGCAISDVYWQTRQETPQEALCATDTECMAFCPPRDLECDGGPSGGSYGR
jgi:hypothetical protein